MFSRKCTDKQCEHIAYNVEILRNYHSALGDILFYRECHQFHRKTISHSWLICWMFRVCVKCCSFCALRFIAIKCKLEIEKRRTCFPDASQRYILQKQSEICVTGGSKCDNNSYRKIIFVLAFRDFSKFPTAAKYIRVSRRM